MVLRRTTFQLLHNGLHLALRLQKGVLVDFFGRGYFFMHRGEVVGLLIDPARSRYYRRAFDSVVGESNGIGMFLPICTH